MMEGIGGASACVQLLKDHKEWCDKRVEKIQAAFEENCKCRANMDLPTVGIVGHGRSGKDLSGEIISEISLLDYSGSTSKIALPFIAKARNVSEDEAWATRHDDRIFWYDFCNHFRLYYGAEILTKGLLGLADISVGIRSKEEYLSVTYSVLPGIVDHWLWIEKPDNEIDPTLEFDWNYVKKRGAIRIINDGTKEDLKQQLYHYCKLLHIHLEDN